MALAEIRATIGLTGWGPTMGKILFFLTLPGALLVTVSLGGEISAAHPGGLNAEGCHAERRTGGYHCHRGPRADRPSHPAGARAGGPFRNCREARAAGAAPVLRGDPGFAPHLDRDDDGVGCE